MDALIRMGVEYGVLIVFATVLIEQLGVPLPAYPVLLFMGSRAAQGELSLPALGMAALSAAVLAGRQPVVFRGTAIRTTSARLVVPNYAIP